MVWFGFSEPEEPWNEVYLNVYKESCNQIRSPKRETASKKYLKRVFCSLDRLGECHAFMALWNGRMATKKRILIICPDGSSTQVIQEATRNWPVLETVVCSSIQEARSHLIDLDIHLIFCQNCLLHGSYLDLLELLKSLSRDVPVILVVPDEDRDFRHREAWAHGVFDVVASPCMRSDVQWMIIRTMQHLKAQETTLRAKTFYAS